MHETMMIRTALLQQRRFAGLLSTGTNPAGASFFPRLLNDDTPAFLRISTNTYYQINRAYSTSSHFFSSLSLESLFARGDSNPNVISSVDSYVCQSQREAPEHIGTSTDLAVWGRGSGCAGDRAQRPLRRRMRNTKSRGSARETMGARVIWYLRLY